MDALAGGTRPDPARIVSAPDGEGLSISVSGDLDAASAASLRAAFVDGLEARPTAIHLVLDDVDFIDSVGISVIVSARKRAEEDGIGLRVASASERCRRVFEICGLTDYLGLA